MKAPSAWTLLLSVSVCALPQPCPLSAQSMFVAAREGDADAVRELLADDPDLASAADADLRTPLHHAAAFGHVQVAVFLLDAGAQLDAEDEDGETPLHYASQLNRREMTEFLLARGADIEARNAYGRTPLLLVARESGNAEMGRILIHAGADVNARDMFNDPPLHLAAWRGFRDLVNLLLDRGAELPPAESSEAMALANFGAEKGLDRLFFRCVDSGVDLSMRNDNNGSLLHSASQGGSAEVVRLLLEQGFDANERDRYGRVPLHYAAEMGHQDVAQTLLEHGADIDAQSLGGETPYNTAQWVEREAMTRFLAEAGSSTRQRRFPVLEGPYLGQAAPAPGTEPVLFAPDIVSTHRSQHGTIAFSPDGAEAFWSSQIALQETGYAQGVILFSRIEHGRWTEPAPAPFSRLGWNDDVPVFAPDNERLYFLSRRPTGSEEGRQAERIWFVTRTPEGWSDPVLIEGGPNLLDLHWSFSVAADGSIYSPGRGDIYVSRLVDGRFTEPRSLGAPVNSQADEGGPYVAPDQSYLVFMRFDHEDNLGFSDLWISFRNEAGGWGDPINLAEPVSTRSAEICPIVSPDRRYLFFNSARNGNNDNFWVDAALIEELRRETPQ